MLDQCIQLFIETRLEDISLNIATPQCRKFKVEQNQIKEAIQAILTDVTEGNLLLDRFDNAIYAQAAIKMNEIYRLGFIDGTKFFKKMALPAGEVD